MSQSGLLEDLFVLPAIVRRHQNAPLMPEREAFLLHLHQRGTGQSNLRNYAGLLNQIISELRLKRLRAITRVEIDAAAANWKDSEIRHGGRPAGPSSAPRFSWIARRFFRFHSKLVEPRSSKRAFEEELKQYEQFMVVDRRLSPVTIKARLLQTAAFLKWFARTRHRPLHIVSLSDVDRYLRVRTNDLNRVSISSCAAILRAFFRYAESRGWCRAGIAAGIKGPQIRTDFSGPLGPKWSEVLRLLRSTRARNRVERRARPILLLFSLYGLRRGEVRRLELSDFNWASRTFTVRRSKRGGIQQFPLRPELSEAVKAYVKSARPQSDCQNLFLSFHPPYGPMDPSSLTEIVRFRMKRLGISSAQMGPHALRRSCATELLRQGASLREIADFLGHRGCECVGIYAKFDREALSRVAVLDLCAAL